jgi:hypothetical protein
MTECVNGFVMATTCILPVSACMFQVGKQSQMLDAALSNTQASWIWISKGRRKEKGEEGETYHM